MDSRILEVSVAYLVLVRGVEIHYYRCKLFECSGKGQFATRSFKKALLALFFSLFQAHKFVSQFDHVFFTLTALWI